MFFGEFDKKYPNNDSDPYYFGWLVIAPETTSSNYFTRKQRGIKLGMLYNISTGLFEAPFSNEEFLMDVAPDFEGTDRGTGITKNYSALRSEDCFGRVNNGMYRQDGSFYYEYKVYEYINSYSYYIRAYDMNHNLIKTNEV